VFNNAVNGEVTGLGLQTDANIVIGNRITNCGTGVDFSSEETIFAWNYIHNNTTDFANPASIGGYANGGYANTVPNDADEDTNEIDADADDGYNNAGNDDLNLKAARTYNGDGNDVVAMNIGS